jgi:hypothetical protein
MSAFGNATPMMSQPRSSRMAQTQEIVTKLAMVSHEQQG